MTTFENVYFYSTSSKPENPVWHRLEKYDNCDARSLSKKRSLFGRRGDKKRAK